MPAMDWLTEKALQDQSFESLLAQRSLAPIIQQSMGVAGLAQRERDFQQAAAEKSREFDQRQQELEQKERELDLNREENRALRQQALDRSKYSALTARLDPQVEGGIAPTLTPEERDTINQVEPGGVTTTMDTSDPDHIHQVYNYHQQLADQAKAKLAAIERQRKHTQDTEDARLDLARRADQRAAQTSTLAQQRFDLVRQQAQEKLKGLNPTGQAQVNAEMKAWAAKNPAPAADWLGNPASDEANAQYVSKWQAQLGTVMNTVSANPMFTKGGASHTEIPGAPGGPSVTPAKPGGGGPVNKQQLFDTYLPKPGGATPPPAGGPGQPPPISQLIPGAMPLMGASPLGDQANG